MTDSFNNIVRRARKNIRYSWVKDFIEIDFCLNQFR